MTDLNIIYENVSGLADYAVRAGLITDRDRTYTINRILSKLKLDSFEECGHGGKNAGDLEGILSVLLDYAAEKGLIESNSVLYRDLFDTELMDCLTPRPSEVAARFERLYEDSPKAATDWYYDFSCKTDYIRTYRIAKDIKWIAPTKYGDLVVTINLSKPEKDPKAIAAALTATQSDYPRCQLCAENEGYAGRVNHPARANHRIIPVTINGSAWFLQYSPYVYYNEHCIVFNAEHTPMKIDHAAFDKLLDFIRQFPHYMVGSNADLPIVGGSILTHDHFQGGNYEFPMARAPIDRPVSIKGYEDVEAGIVKWPMTVLRLTSSDAARLSDCADKVLKAWREYSDDSQFIFAYTRRADSEPVTHAPVTYDEHSDDYIPHNTITPIARMRNGRYELDLVLRNNITTQEHPLGVYHPHSEHHHIKKENIGLIEVMGLAILPARLKKELSELANALAFGKDISEDEVLGKHADWISGIRGRYDKESFSDSADALEILKKETGLVYADILDQCGVFKRTASGQEALMRFIRSIG